MIWLGLALAAEPRVAPTALPPERPTVPALREERLSGGAKVLLAEQGSVPLFEVDLAVTAQVDTPLDRQLAQLAGELLGTGTTLRDGDAWQDALTALGARAHFRFASRRLEARLRVPRGNEEQALALLAEAVLEPRFDEGTVRVALEAWRQDRASVPYTLQRIHERALNHALLPTGHPMRQSGLLEDLDELGGEAAQALLERTLEHGRVTLAVVSDRDPAALLPELERRFGGLDGAAEPQPYPSEVNPGARWFVARSGFEVAKLSVAMPGPAMGDADEAPLRILTRLLMGGFDSRINMDLREQQGLTYSATGEMAAWQGMGTLRIDLLTPNDRAAEALLAVEGHLDRVEAEGVTQAEVDRALAHLLLETAQDFSRVESAGKQLFLAGFWSLGADVWDRNLDALEAVTPADVALAARKWLVPERRVWVVTGSQLVVVPELERIDRTPDHLVSAEDVAAER